MNSVRASSGDPQTVRPGLKLIRETLLFLRSHWVHALILPLMALAVTVLHETAHAAAVWVQGGTVVDFVWLPSPRRWGYVQYEFPEHAQYSSFAISVAPYCLWLTLAAATATVGCFLRKPPFWVGSALYAWCFCMPLADVANAAFPYLTGRDNDLMEAFGRPGVGAWLGVALVTGTACVVGFPLQRRLYGERSLPLRAYAVLTGLSVAGIAVVSGAV